MKVKILLINAIDEHRRVESIYPPLNLAYLVSYAKSRIQGNKAIFKIINEDYEKEISSFSPDMVGVSCVTQNYGIATDIALFCRNMNIPIFIGGVHISTLPTSFNDNFDFGVMGEGEKTFLNIIKLFIDKKKFTKKDLSKIDGLVFSDNEGRLKFTKPQKLVENLDSIPFPSRNLLDIDKNIVFMISSRGCPYNCYFCSSSSFWNKIRFHSADYVVEEINKVISDYGPRRISFYDDLFIASKTRLADIVKKIESLEINKKVEFHISARANLLNEDVVALLKRMNVKSVNMGFESGSDKVLKYLKGDSVSIDDNLRSVALLKKYGFRIGGSFVIGSPIDDKKTLSETYNFIKKSKIDDFAVYALTPYPKTRAWEYALAKGIVSENMDFSQLCIDYPKDYTRKITLCPNLSKKELYSFYKKCQRLYLMRRAMLAGKMLFKDPLIVFRKLFRRLRFMDLGGYN